MDAEKTQEDLGPAPRLGPQPYKYFVHTFTATSLADLQTVLNADGALGWYIVQIRFLQDNQYIAVYYQDA